MPPFLTYHHRSSLCTLQFLQNSRLHDVRFLAPFEFDTQMAKGAILALKERNGSSIPAIKKHIEATYPTLNFLPHQLRSALKKGTEAGMFIKVRVTAGFRLHIYELYARYVSFMTHSCTGVCSACRVNCRVMPKHGRSGLCAICFSSTPPAFTLRDKQ